MVSNFARITLAVAFCLAASLFAGAVQAADPVKIGFAGPMTGPVSAFGNEIKRGIDMAIAAVNAKGGVKGRMFEVVVRDDEFDPVKTVSAYPPCWP
jgi:branched-chain amino acid transport system substrate-binding protein